MQRKPAQVARGPQGAVVAQACWSGEASLWRQRAAGTHPGGEKWPVCEGQS